jgi:hypothetical protein
MKEQIMVFQTRSMLAALVLTAAVFLSGGCKSDGMSAMTPEADRMSDVIVIYGSHGMMTTYSMRDGKMVVTNENGAKPSPEDEAAAMAYFKTGIYDTSKMKDGYKRMIMSPSVHGRRS